MSKKFQWIALAVAVLALGTLIFQTVRWNRYIEKTFGPIIETLIDTAGIPENPHGSSSSGSVSIFRSRGYLYHVGVPSRLNFGGYISAETQGGTDHEVGLTIHPRNGDWQYVLSLRKRINAYNSWTVGSAVDRDGRPLGRHPEDAEETYEEWLSRYDEYQDSVIELIDHINDLFGEDAFR